MGRGDRPAPASQVLRRRAARYEVTVVEEAIAELDELIGYVLEQSLRNATCRSKGGEEVLPMSAFEWSDPYDQMSDEELDEYAAMSFAKRAGTVAVSLRIAPDQLARLKREAARAGVPYQTFMKGMLEAGLSRLERRPRRARTRMRTGSRGRGRVQ